jgi:hypothetical protein
VIGLRVWTRLVALCLLGAGVSACRDSTGPKRELNVALEARLTDGPTVGLSESGATNIRCGIALTAVGSGVGKATWEHLTLLFYAGRDRSAPIDSSIVEAATVAQFWDNAEIDAGETLETQLSISAGVPFAATLVFHYRVMEDDTPKSVQASFTCGAVIPPTGPLPSIPVLTVQPSSGVVEYGQPLTITFTAESPSGLVDTELVLSGACVFEVINAERLATTVTRTITVPLPSGCRTDRPLVITVSAFDGALEQVTRSISVPLTRTDTTPPTLSPLFFLPTGGNSFVPAGEYFVGDSIHMIVGAFDAHGLTHLMWEVLPAGIRDSIPLAQAGGGTVKIPIPASWGEGGIELRFQVRDLAGLTSRVVSSQPGAVRVHPTVVRPARSADLVGDVNDLVFDPRRGVAYLMQRFERRVAVFSLATMTVVRTIDVPTIATDIEMSLGGDSLVLALPQSKALGIVDLRAAVPSVSLLPLTVLDESIQQVPRLVRVASTGRAFVSLEGSAGRGFQLAEVDFTTGVQRLRLDAGDGGRIGAAGLERSGNRRVLVMNGGPGEFQRYDAVADQFGPRRSAIPFSTRARLDATGARALIGLDVYDEALTKLVTVGATVVFGIPPATLSPGGEYVYMALWNHGIVRSRVSDGAVVDRSPNPIRPDAMWVSPDGAFIITVDQAPNANSRISVVDMR